MKDIIIALCLICVNRQCVPCTLDEVLGPPTTPEGRNDEKALLEQLVSFLSGTDDSELAELDKALGIDKLVQVSIWWRLQYSGETGREMCFGFKGVVTIRAVSEDATYFILISSNH